MTQKVRHAFKVAPLPLPLLSQLWEGKWGSSWLCLRDPDVTGATGALPKQAECAISVRGEIAFEEGIFKSLPFCRLHVCVCVSAEPLVKL